MRIIVRLGGLLVGLVTTAAAQVGDGGTLERLILPLDGGLAHDRAAQRPEGSTTAHCPLPLGRRGDAVGRSSGLGFLRDGIRRMEGFHLAPAQHDERRLQRVLGDAVQARPGDRLTLPLRAPAAGTYDVIGFFTRAQDYGIIRLHLNGQPLQSLMDGYNRSVVPGGPISFGRVPLRAGSNELVIELLGKDARAAGYADGYLVGIDGFVLRSSQQ